MQLRHRPSDAAAPRTLATEVSVARSRLAQARGLMFRRSIPADYALAFPFEDAGVRTLHMLFVPFAIDALWLLDDRVTTIRRLPPFVGIGRGEADMVVELPAGGAVDVAVGDEVRLSQ